MPRSPAIPHLLSAATLLLVTHIWVNARQPAAYMDELFHVPQAQQFCRAAVSRTSFHYHPSITTPPGLYIAPALLALAARTDAFCTPGALRAYVSCASLLVLVVLRLLLRALRARESRAVVGGEWSLALALWLHPVFWFYSHLMYTDVPAVLFALVAWLLALDNQHAIAAMAGLVAALMRQTNMVWHGFVAVDALVAKQREENRFAARVSVGPVAKALRSARHELSPHVCVGVLYCLFLAWNRGPALGDRENHAVSMHYAMYPYFLGFHALSYLPFQFGHPALLKDQVVLFRRSSSWAIMFTFACAILALLVTATGDAVHPFILADNRHFTFYIYRRWLLQSRWHRLAPVPFYAWGAIAPILELHTSARPKSEKKEGKRATLALPAQLLAKYVTLLVFHCCVVITLVPSPLMEPRYFVLASTILSVWRLAQQRERACVGRLIAACALLLVIDVGLVYVFAEMPFRRSIDRHMPSDLSPGRFMF